MAGTSVEHGAGHDVATPEVGPGISYNPDAPSEEWGWHGHWRDFAPRGRAIMLLVGVAGLLLMLNGNHTGHVEDIYLILFAAGILLWMGRTEIVRRREKRTKP